MSVHAGWDWSLTTTTSRWGGRLLWFKELINDPVTHLGVVCRDSYECGFDKIRFDGNKRNQMIEGILNLLNCLLLISDDFENISEVSGAYDWEYFKSSLLLFLLNVADILSNLGQIETEKWNIVYRKSRLFIELIGKRAIFKACQNVSSHSELDKLNLEILKSL